MFTNLSLKAKHGKHDAREECPHLLDRKPARPLMSQTPPRLNQRLSVPQVRATDPMSITEQKNKEQRKSEGRFEKLREFQGAKPSGSRDHFLS